MAFEPWRRASRSCVARVVVLAVLLLPTATLADPSPVDRESARALMDEGDRRYDAQSYEAALQAYGAANAIMNVPTTGYAVARTLAALGRFVEARDLAMLVVLAPVKPHEPRPFVLARDAAQKLADDLVGSIASFAIRVEGPPVDIVQVDIDGLPVPAALLELPRKTDPGAHVIRATAPGFIEQRREVSVARGENASLVLTLRPQPLAVPKRPLPSPPSLSEQPVPPVATGWTTDRAALSGDTQRTTAIVVGGSGLAVLSVGGVLALSALSKYNGAIGCNPQGACNAEGYRTRNDARSLGVAATLVMGLGASALVTGAVMYIVAPRAVTSARVGISPSGAVIEGTF